MQALFIGQSYIDVTFLTDRMPVGDEKHVATEYAVSFGGNAVTAAFCCRHLPTSRRSSGNSPSLPVELRGLIQTPPPRAPGRKFESNSRFAPGDCRYRPEVHETPKYTDLD